jgi:hypothetical protein
MQDRKQKSAIWIGLIATAVGALGTSSGCKQRSQAGGPDAGASAIAPVASLSASAHPPAPPPVPMASGIPIPAASVQVVLNPDGVAPYDGPVGTVEGIVRMKGDPPPKLHFPIDPKCPRAVEMYESLFREGPGRVVGDVLVAATGYDGYVPAVGTSRRVDVGGCVFESRTVDATFGQNIEVHNIDPATAYLPRLAGARNVAELVAVPHGDPVRLFPSAPGQYALVDDMARDWMYADVFVLKFPTHAVTTTEGRYRITGIPAGKVKLSAYLPVSGSLGEKDVTIRSGQTTTADFELSFDAKKYARERAAASAAAASARPVPSGPRPPPIH